MSNCARAQRQRFKPHRENMWRNALHIFIVSASSFSCKHPPSLPYGLEHRGASPSRPQDGEDPSQSLTQSLFFFFLQRRVDQIGFEAAPPAAHPSPEGAPVSQLLVGSPATRTASATLSALLLNEEVSPGLSWSCMTRFSESNSQSRLLGFYGSSARIQTCKKKKKKAHWYRHFRRSFFPVKTQATSHPDCKQPAVGLNVTLLLLDF